MTDKEKAKIHRCQGDGLGSCKRCEDNGYWNRHWMCFLYKIDGMDGIYCRKCVEAIMEVAKDNDGTGV